MGLFEPSPIRYKAIETMSQSQLRILYRLEVSPIRKRVPYHVITRKGHCEATPLSSLSRGYFLETLPTAPSRQKKYALSLVNLHVACGATEMASSFFSPCGQKRRSLCPCRHSNNHIYPRKRRSARERPPSSNLRSRWKRDEP